jgi:hypothetical protein
MHRLKVQVTCGKISRHLWPPDRQMTTFLESNAPHLAITQRGRYITLVSKLASLNVAIKGVVEMMQCK